MPSTLRLRLASVALLVCVVALDGLSIRHTAAQDAGYTLVDLGPLVATGEATGQCPESYGGGVSAINATGQVTGDTPWTDRASAAFRATDGGVKRLKSGKGGGAGLDINADGQVVGYVSTARPDDLCDYATSTSVDRAATWDGSTLTELPVADDAERSRATAINDDGLIVGHYSAPREIETADSFSSFNVTMPVMWVDGALTELPIPDVAVDVQVFAEPVDVNAAGQIVGGLSGAAFPEPVSALWEDGEITLLPDGFRATAINDDGVVVGTVGTVEEGFTASRLVDGELEALPDLPDDLVTSGVSGINAVGDMVGFVGVPGEDDETVFTAVVWLDDEMVEFATLFPADADVEPGGVVDINDAGMILGYGDPGDDYRGIVLVPEEA